MAEPIDIEELRRYADGPEPIDIEALRRLADGEPPPDVANWPRQVAQGVVRGAHNRVLGIRGAVDDLGRWGRAEFGMPYSDDRQRLIQEVHDAKQAAKDASIPDKVGQFVYSTAEGAALPMVNRFGFAGGLLTDTLGSGMLGLLDPAETPDERMNNAKTGLVFGAGARPMGMVGSMGINTGRNILSTLNPDFYRRDAVNAAARQIRDMREAASDWARREGLALGDVDFGGAGSGGSGAGGGAGGGSIDGGRWDRIPGLRPTAAMIYQQPAIMQLEKAAAVRNGDLFLERYIANQKAVGDAMREKLPAQVTLPNGNTDYSYNLLRDEVNNATTPMRDQAFASAEASYPGSSAIFGNRPYPHLQPFQTELRAMGQEKGSRINQSVQSLVDDGNDLFIDAARKGVEVSPADVYAYRKRLNDALAGIGNDANLTNAAKAEKAAVMRLKTAIDDGLNGASGGAWGQYLDTHQNLMQPVNEQQAMQNIWDSLSTKTLPDHPDYPEITRNALSNAIKKHTWMDLGRTGKKDIMSPDTRSILDQSKDAVQAMEHARGGTNALLGSQTTPLLFEATAPVLRQLGKATKFGWALDLADALGKSHGQMALDDALLNPEKLPAVLKAYESGQLGAEYSPLAQAIKRAIRNGNGLLGD